VLHPLHAGTPVAVSDRHMHVTGYLYGQDPACIFRFIEAAARTGLFHEVIPVRRGDGSIIAVAFYSKDLDGFSDELEMPGIARRLSGILDRDIEIASAWDSPQPDREREHAWLVRGRGAAIQGQVVADHGELASSAETERW